MQSVIGVQVDVAASTMCRCVTGGRVHRNRVKRYARGFVHQLPIIRTDVSGRSNIMKVNNSIGNILRRSLSDRGCTFNRYGEKFRKKTHAEVFENLFNCSVQDARQPLQQGLQTRSVNENCW